MPFVIANFSGVAGSNISTVTGGTGNVWTYGTPSANPILLDGAGNIRGTGAGVQSVVFASGVPASPDYTVSAIAHYYSLLASINIGVIARGTGTNWYYGGHDNNSGLWVILKSLGGALSELATTPAALIAGNDYPFDLVVAGNTITLRVSGSVVLSVTDVSSPITAAGLSGVWAQGAESTTTGTALKSFSATDAAVAPVVIYPDNAAFRFIGFWLEGAGSSARANCVNDGNRLRIAFINSTTAVVGLDITRNIGLTQWPVVSIRVDGGAWTEQRLSAVNNTVSLAGLSLGKHELEIFADVCFVGENSWNNVAPQSVISVASLTLDSGASVVAPKMRSKVYFFFGDSILATQNQSFRARKNWPYKVGELNDAEVVAIGWPHQGYNLEIYLAALTTTFPNTWRYYSDSVSRLTRGVFSQRPTLIYIAHGENGTPTATIVQNLITEMRAAFPGPLLVQRGSVNGTNASVIQAGVAAYIAATPSDTHVHDINLGTLTLAHVPPDMTHISESDAFLVVAPAVAAAILAVEGASGVVPSPSHVRYGITVGASTGTLRVPSAAQTLEGVLVDATTGTVVLPPVSKVRVGTSYGASSALSGTDTLPSVSQVLAGVTFGSGGNEFSGTLPVGTFPLAAQVSTGITFGPTNNLTGTVTQPVAGAVQSGVQYGAGGTQFIGTLSASGGGLTTSQAAKLQSVYEQMQFLIPGFTVSTECVRDGVRINRLAADAWNIAINALGSLSASEKLWFCIKARRQDADAAALLFIEKTAGLLYVNGAPAPDSTAAVLIIEDPASGNIRLTVLDSITAALPVGTAFWTVKKLTFGEARTLVTGSFEIVAPCIAAVS